LPADQNPAPPLWGVVVGGTVVGGVVVGGGADVVADPMGGAGVVVTAAGTLLVWTLFELDPHAAKPTLTIVRQTMNASRRRFVVRAAGPIRLKSLTLLVHPDLGGRVRPRRSPGLL